MEHDATEQSSQTPGMEMQPEKIIRAIVDARYTNALLYTLM